MRRTLLLSCVLMTGLGSLSSWTLAAQETGRAPRNAEEYDALFQRVKNWGRWGADDQLGAANLVTDSKRRQAARLVKLGLTVSLAHRPLTDKAEDNTSPIEHTMNRGFTTDT